MTHFQFDEIQKTIFLTLTSLSNKQKRSVSFKHVDCFREETLEDYDGGSEWTIIGFHSTKISEELWHIELQCLEKGFFFNSSWPTVTIMSV
ncbi:MAG: hypothetical protein OHK0022_41800 [Roseiflexaceae bacterium]